MWTLAKDGLRSDVKRAVAVQWRRNFVDSCSAASKVAAEQLRSSVDLFVHVRNDGNAAVPIFEADGANEEALRAFAELQVGDVDLYDELNLQSMEPGIADMWWSGQSAPDSTDVEAITEDTAAAGAAASGDAVSGTVADSGAGAADTVPAPEQGEGVIAN